MKKIVKRKNQRLKNFDYWRNWYYFITICTEKRKNYFGKIFDWIMVLNKYWKIAENVFLNLPAHYENCVLDEFIFMPNHFHWIIIIDTSNLLKVSENSRNNDFIKNNHIDWNIFRTGFKPVPTRSYHTKKHWLSEIIRWFKTFSSRNINNNIKNKYAFSWQRSFFDMIIKNDEQLNKARQYIINNPLKWNLDENNPKNLTN